MTLFSLITDNTTIVTPNSRLSAALQRQYQTHQLENGKQSWRTLDVLPITSWLERLWQELTGSVVTTSPLLLKANQEKCLWEKIIAESPDYDYLLQKTATADLAKSALDMLKSWQIDFHEPEIAITEDGHAFQQWAGEFEKHCEQHFFLGRNSLPDEIRDAILAKQIKPPQRLILIGFTEISPQFKKLFSSCEKNQCEIIHYQTEHKANPIRKIALMDEETEIRTMARWAKAIYDQDRGMKPYTIGCVILNLDKLRNKVQQIFSETFTEPHSFTFDNNTLPFNITAGKYLIDYPVIHTAFELLNLHKKEFSLEKFSHILRSPFLGDAEAEQNKRAHLETKLRSVNAASISLRELSEKNSLYAFTNTCPKLAKRAKEFLELADGMKQSQLASAWANQFLALLKALGWPGERSISSPEYQTIARWLDVLNEFRTYDTILGSLSMSQAVYHLNQLTARDVYQIKTEDAPIQVLGIFEAVELSFQHLWVMGLDDTTWPQPPKPNPLIPLRLQKRLNMPHATAEREYLYAEELMNQIQHSAQNLVFSHAQKKEDAELQPSPLLTNIPEILPNELTLSDFISPAEQIFLSRQLETCLDSQAPPVNETENIRGGTDIFKKQAACPFKAFAEVRLHARPLETPTLGLRALDRGNIIHKALELTWRAIKTSEMLIKLSRDEISNIIHHAVKEAIHVTVTQHDEKIRYIELEQQRLEKLLADWLQIEMARSQFSVIKQEHKREITFGNIKLVIRIDRIDRLADGRHLIIDYKTGKNSAIQSWFGTRPDEPQLPLYCVTDEEETIAIAFAQVNSADMKFIGVSKIDIGIPSVKLLNETSGEDQDIWTNQLTDWKKVLEKLAQDFSNGVATVDPKKNNETCSLCHLQPLCRIHEK